MDLDAWFDFEWICCQCDEAKRFGVINKSFGAAAARHRDMIERFSL
jgi:hypothetical protein